MQPISYPIIFDCEDNQPIDALSWGYHTLYSEVSFLFERAVEVVQVQEEELERIVLS
jgi:hypothetical protein